MADLDPMATALGAIEFFYTKPWSDGMPVLPPDNDRVNAMLAGTRRAPDDVIGLVPPNFEPLTVRRIAEHAVMAGALPEYMPALVGAMQAILDEKLNMHGVQTTIHGVAPLLIVNGPYAKKIGINGGRGCFGPGYDGPCPPWNDTILHHYVFTLYALDIEKCPVSGTFKGLDVLAAIRGHVLTQAAITGIYSLNPNVKV